MKTRKSVMQLRRQRGDAGMAFMVELLIVMAIVVGLVAIVGPKFMDYLNRGQDTAVQSDLKNYATTAEANLINTGGSSYGTTAAAAFGVDGAAPVASKDNKYRAWVVAQGEDAGYVIIGVNRNSEKAWVVSSYTGSAVKQLSPNRAGAAFSSNATPPAGHFPTGVTPTSIPVWGTTS